MEDQLLLAIEEEDYRLAQELILRGADVNKLVRDDISVLHLISGYESGKASVFLNRCLLAGANPNIRSTEGITPVHVAALWSRLHNLEILITNGGDPDQLDNEGSNALDYACLSSEKNADRCVKYLLELEHSSSVKEAQSDALTVKEPANPRVLHNNSYRHFYTIDSQHTCNGKTAEATLGSNIPSSEGFQETSNLLFKPFKRTTNMGYSRIIQEDHSGRNKLNINDLDSYKFSTVGTRGSDSDDELAESFYTAFGDNSDNNVKLHSSYFTDTLCKSNYLHESPDDSEVTFPKLHPWSVKNLPTDFDDTRLGKLDNSDNIPDQFANSFSDSKKIVARNEQLSNCQNLSLEEDLDDSVFTDVTILYDWKEFSVVEESKDDSVCIPDSCRKLSDIELRKELRSLGEVPGPITSNTRQVYIRRLARLRSGSVTSKEPKYAEYFPELRAHLEGRSITPDLFKEEESMCEEFNVKKSWREGTEKSSFNYVLLDPRVTQNLPARAKKMNANDVFKVFILAVFYVGKGKRSRPYAHLCEAVQSSKKSPKLLQIQDIWSAGLGVVSLHIFQSVIPVEAYTREACMIDALGLSRLTSKKRGDYYGRAKWWPQKKKREMGVYLLKRALKIFLSEGERQIRREDLKVSHSSC